MKNKKSLIYKVYKARWCYIALLPTMLLLCIFKLYPAIEGIYYSMCNWKTRNYFSPVFSGLTNYKRLFGDAVFWGSFRTLLIFIIAGFITTFGVCMPASYLIHKLGSTRPGKFFQRAFVIPMMIPGMVTIMFWRFFYSYQDGILNTVLRLLGREDLIQIWLGDKRITIWALLFMNFPWIGGFSFLVLFAGFLNIDSSLEEAAELDGANAWKKFFLIDLPLVIPQIKILSILGMIAGIQSFNTQMIMTNGKFGTMVPGLYMYQTAFTDGNYGYASAMGVTLFGIILIITILQNKYVKKMD